MIIESKLIISEACNVLNMSERTFYRWRNEKEISDKDTKIRSVMHEIATEFPSYGYRRITKELQNKDIKINHKHVSRLMHEEGIVCRRKNRFRPVTTQSNHNEKIYPNLAKDFKPTGLNQLWVSDITYIQLLQGFVYLAVIIDVYSRKCIGWSLSTSIDTILTITALKRAIKQRIALGFEGLIHHSDQGIQYASKEYIQLLEEHNITISMSRRAHPYDNAFAESFIKTLKVEEVYLNEYNTIKDVKENIERFIEQVYNLKRLHSSLSYQSPIKFEQEILNNINN